MARNKATVTTNTPTPVLASLPDAWADATVLEGVDLIDKATLVDIPFLITGAKFTVNARDITMVWVEGERIDKTTFTFTDSSTGVLATMLDYVKGVLGGVVPSQDVWTNLRVVAPKGLRVSHYTVKDERGKDRDASTYYLTTSGQRA
jgi:hypothetical protein